MREEMRSHFEIARLASPPARGCLPPPAAGPRILAERDRPYDRRRRPPSRPPRRLRRRAHSALGPRSLSRGGARLRQRCPAQPFRRIVALGSLAGGPGANRRHGRRSRSFPRFVVPPPRARDRRTGPGSPGWHSGHGPATDPPRPRPGGASPSPAVNRTRRAAGDVRPDRGRTDAGTLRWPPWTRSARRGNRRVSRSGLLALRARAPISQARPRGGPSATVGEHVRRRLRDRRLLGGPSGSGSNSTHMTSTAAGSRSSGTGCARRI